MMMTVELLPLYNVLSEKTKNEQTLRLKKKISFKSFFYDLLFNAIFHNATGVNYPINLHKSFYIS